MKFVAIHRKRHNLIFILTQLTKFIHNSTHTHINLPYQFKIYKSLHSTNSQQPTLIHQMITLSFILTYKNEDKMFTICRVIEQLTQIELNVQCTDRNTRLIALNEHLENECCFLQSAALLHFDVHVLQRLAVCVK